MLHIKFRYQDEYTKPGCWSEQECTMSSVQECIKFYGLDQPDVTYQIVEVKEVK